MGGFVLLAIDINND